MTILPFDSDKWQKKLIEKEEDVEINNNGTSLTLKSGKNTDWWRSSKESIPEANVNRHNGPLYVFEIESNCKFWTSSVWIEVNHKERFQQATLFIGVDNFLKDSISPWLKAGIEIENDEQNIGSVVSSPISDWTLFLSPKEINSNQWLYIEAKRTGDDIILSFSIENSKNIASSLNNKISKHLMREIKGFANKFNKNEIWNIGVMTCGPKSNSTISKFHNFSFTKDY